MEPQFDLKKHSIVKDDRTLEESLDDLNRASVALLESLEQLNELLERWVNGQLV